MITCIFPAWKNDRDSNFGHLALVAACCIPMQGLIAQNGIGYPQEDVVKVAESDARSENVCIPR